MKMITQIRHRDNKNPDNQLHNYGPLNQSINQMKTLFLMSASICSLFGNKRRSKLIQSFSDSKLVR